MRRLPELLSALISACRPRAWRERRPLTFVLAALLFAGGALAVLAIARGDVESRRDDRSITIPSPADGQLSGDGISPTFEGASAGAHGADPTGAAEPNEEEIARRLAGLPAGRWDYALALANQRAGRPQRAISVPRRVVTAPPASALGFSWPVRGVVSSPFGEEHPLGIDIAPFDSLGLVMAARDGRVAVAGGDPCCGYGYYVLLDHGEGLTSIYGHFREPPFVQPGERVERGTVLGLAGDTGHSYGVHLHFEVRLYGVSVDPEAVLTGGQLTPLASRTLPPPAPARPAADTVAPEAPAATPVPVDTTPTDPPEAEEPSPAPEPVAPSPAPRTTDAPDVSPSPRIDPSLGGAGPAAPRQSPVPSAPASEPAPRPVVITPAPSQTPTAQPPPSPVPAPSALLSPSALPSPSASPSAAPSASPRCLRFDWQEPGVRPRAGDAPEEERFVTLRTEPGVLSSLSAERCGAGSPSIVTARTAAGRHCIAVLTGKPGEEGRKLIPMPASSGSPLPESEASAETRWLIPSADLGPGVELRVSCAPVGATGP